MTTIRGLRGATTVAADRAELIEEAVQELLLALLERNGVTADDVVSAWFTATPDLTSDFPARGARHLGWREVPMLCAQEIDVDGALPRCLRVLLHVEVEHGAALRPLYLRDARELRPDLATAPTDAPRGPSD